MIPYEMNKINSLLDVKAEYPSLFNMADLNKRRVRVFIKELLNEHIENAMNKYEFEYDIGLYPRKPSKAQLTREYIDIATAKGLYKYYWCKCNVLDQICKYGYCDKDLKPIMQRMEQSKKFNPWATTEPTAGQFLESLKNYGCKRIKTKDGDEYFVHNAKGYGAEKDDSEDVRNDRDDKYYF